MTSNGSNDNPVGWFRGTAIDWRRFWPVATIAVLAAIVRCFIWLNSDVSWLLTVGEKLLGGARAYVDFNETNPPASILLYLPAILLGRISGVPAEFALTILVFVGVFLSLFMVDGILPGGALVQSREKAVLLALAGAVLLILPGDNFAEREHIALIAILPMLAVYASRALNSPVSTISASVAGLGGGIAVAIKPYFALALVLPLFYVLWRRRSSVREFVAVVFSPEHFTAALVVLVYGTMLLWVFSEYTQHTLPLILALYVPLKYSLLLMIANPSVILVAMVTILALCVNMSEFRLPPLRVANLAMLGFVAALIIQGKGWPYHGYPAVALSMLGFSILLVRRLSVMLATPKKSLSIDLAFGAALFVVVYALASFWLLQEPSRARLVTEVARLVPAHPKVVSIEGGPSVAFPLTRQLHGISIGRTPFQWISAFTDRMLTVGELGSTGDHKTLDPVTRRKYEDYARRDRQELADSIRTGHPDVILIGGNSERVWAFSHPEIAAVLRSYHRAEIVDGVEIWLPQKASKVGHPWDGATVPAPTLERK